MRIGPNPHSPFYKLFDFNKINYNKLINIFHRIALKINKAPSRT